MTGWWEVADEPAGASTGYQFTSISLLHDVDAITRWGKRQFRFVKHQIHWDRIRQRLCLARSLSS